jgi:serine protease Do
MALGSPLGLRNSVSLGVVSAVARQMEPESPMIYIQTDAAINAGSSGGALVDLLGRLVGINTMIASQTGGNEGLAFAAPGNIVQAVYQQIRKTGRVRRGDLGIRAQTITPELASGLGLPRNRGVVLADVIPRSSAAVAGLRAGDIVLSLDGKAMENGRQLRVDLYRRAVGEIVSLQILRGETVSVFPVAVEERRDLTGLSAAVDPRQNLVQRLGILGLTLTPQLADVVPVVRVRSGVVVASTVANALDAKDGGLAPGDTIYAVNRTSVSALDDLRSALGAFKPGDAVVLQIERRGELMFLTFTID